MNGAYVFFSHANEDKKRLRAIVDALIAAGIKIWMDTPQNLGYSDREIEDNFINLHAGAEWKHQIFDALRECQCVLLCWSANAARKYQGVIRTEADAGRVNGKLSVCTIETIANTPLPAELSAEHVLDLSNNQGAVLTQVVADVVSVMKRSAKRHKDKRISHDVFLPYLIDRERQAAHVRGTIDRAGKGQIEALIVKAPRNECLDQFIVRLERHTSTKCLQGNPWHQINVEWPLEEHPQRFIEAYERDLAHALCAGPDTLGSQLSRRLPVAPVSIIHIDDWSRHEHRKLEAWIDWWTAQVSANRKLRAIPILGIELPPAPPKWKKFPPGKGVGGMTAKRIWKDVSKLIARTARDDTTTTLSLLDILPPVSMSDAHKWQRSEFEADDVRLWTRLSQTIESVFRAQRSKVSIADFAAQMEPILTKGLDKTRSP